MAFRGRGYELGFRDTELSVLKAILRCPMVSGLYGSGAEEG